MNDKFTRMFIMTIQKILYYDRFLQKQFYDIYGAKCCNKISNIKDEFYT